MEGRGQHSVVSDEDKTTHTGEMKKMGKDLFEIRYNIEKANRTDGKVQNLAVYINEETLREAHKGMDKKKARGIDNMSKEDYSVNLKENLKSLMDRMRKGSYRPEASRRTYIPKVGSLKGRPLGISCYEDKLVEKVIAQILETVYEPKFLDVSFGFRRGRNCHQAVREIIEMAQYRKTNYVVEADMKGFFDNVDHEWLLKFLEHDLADKRFLEIIEKFLKAGIIEAEHPKAMACRQC